MSHPTKATVHCKMIEPLSKYRVGQRALVYPRDHTSPFVSNTMIATTSTIVKIDVENNSFETINSVYVCEGLIDA